MGEVMAPGAGRARSRAAARDDRAAPARRSGQAWSPLMKPVGMYLLRPDALDEVYGPSEQAEAAALLELPHPPQSPASIRSDPSPLRDVEVLLAGWGLPRLDSEILESAPRLRLVLSGGGSARPVVTPELWSRGIPGVPARAAHSLPGAGFTLARILFSLQHGLRLIGATRRPLE